MSIGEIVILCVLLAEWLRAELRIYLRETLPRRRMRRAMGLTRDIWRKAVEDLRHAKEEDHA